MKRILTVITIICSLSFVTVATANEMNLQEEIVYNIIIDRFNNGDQSLNDHVDIDDPYNYHGGDFEGITKRLNHLEALGFTTIVLSPIMETDATGFHGYTVENFFNLNKNYGSLEALESLIEQAQKRGIKVIVEIGLNYAAITNPLVTDSEKKDWFRENTYVPGDDESSLYWLDDVVQFDQTNPDVQQYLLSVTEHWLDELNIDGIKLHAADQLDPEFLETLATTIKEKNPNSYLFAHILDGETDISRLQNMPTIDGVENPEMFRVLADTFAKGGLFVANIYETWKTIGHEKDLLFTETKDTARFANYAALNERTALTAWKLALTYLYTTPGTPYMYQGNELQMFGLEFPETQQMMLFNSTDPDLEEFHDKLSTMREDIPALTMGEFSQVAVNGGLSVFNRTFENEVIYIAINNDEIMQDIILEDIPTDQQLRGLFVDEIIRSNQDDEFIITMPRESIEIYVVEPNFGMNWYYIAFVAAVFVVFLSSIFYLSRKQKLREQGK